MPHNAAVYKARYLRLRKAGCCVKCAKPADKATCKKCRERKGELRRIRVAHTPTPESPSVVVMREPPLVPFRGVPRCRCGLMLPCESCLPGIDHYAERRVGYEG